MTRSGSSVVSVAAAGMLCWLALRGSPEPGWVAGLEVAWVEVYGVTLRGIGELKLLWLWAGGASERSE